jgi:hypothetical protein
MTSSARVSTTGDVFPMTSSARLLRAEGLSVLLLVSQHEMVHLHVATTFLTVSAEECCVSEVEASSIRKSGNKPQSYSPK